MPRIAFKTCLYGACAGIALLAGGFDIPQASAQSQTAQMSGAEEIIVTARRRSEALSKVPVAISAFSPEKLLQSNVQATTDLQKLTPGVVFSGAGSAENTTFTIRGQGRFVIGGVLPSVISYFNDVPLGSWGAVLPAFDMANIQVLKGPQGTLFGRNTTGGAVLVNSKAPTYEFGGYLQGTYGSYNWMDGQGAINIPIVKDKLAIRLATQFQRRDGYTEVIGVGRDRDDLHSDAYRASILFEPTDFIKNTTVYDYYHSDTGGQNTAPNGIFTVQNRADRQYVVSGASLTGLAFLVGVPSTYPNCGTSPSCDVDLAVQQAVAGGPRRNFSGAHNSTRASYWGVSNTTEIELGPVRIKNIFGIRDTQIRLESHTDGMPFVLEIVPSQRSDHQLTEELQFSGGLFDDKLEWLLGGFYLENSMPGSTGLKFDAFRVPELYPTDSTPTPALVTLFAVPGIPAGTPLSALLGPFNPGSAVQNALFQDQSRAVFGQLIYHFTGWLDGVSLNGSIRYTSDREEACSINVQPYNTPFIRGFDACTQTPGASVGRTAANKVTWQLGADYRVTDNLFLYVVGRKGYRGGGLNTPELGGTLTQFQDFKPQTVTDVEIGAKTRWSSGSWGGIFNIALFRGEFDSLQRAVAGIPPGIDGDSNPLNDPSNTTLYVNVKGATVQGVEIDGSISPFSDLTFTYGGSYLDASIEPTPSPAALAGISGTENKFENAPNWSYTVGVDYHLPLDSNLGQFYIHGDRYWVHHYNVGVVTLPTYALHNFSIDWREIAGKPITASFFVQNAFDKDYLISSTLSGTSPGFATVSYGPPQIFGFKVRWEFGAG